ncbi:MAG TPA: lytic transglycosylase domain-containing protein [Nitrospira sp.]|nr:lytic transglycosylase domain-containing protein [Nitrospira sp.]
MLTWLSGMTTCHTDMLRRVGQASCTVLMAMLIVLGVPTATNSDFDSRQHYSQQEIRRAIVFYARRYRLDPALLRAVMKAESGYRQHVVSKKGAIGLMQLTPDTAATLRVANVYDSMENIRGGAKQLRHLLNLYGSDLPLALAAYNAGVHRVKGRTVPRIRETRAYVRKVLRYYRALKGEHRLLRQVHPQPKPIGGEHQLVKSAGGR